MKIAIGLFAIAVVCFGFWLDTRSDEDLKKMGVNLGG